MFDLSSSCAFCRSSVFIIDKSLHVDLFTIFVKEMRIEIKMNLKSFGSVVIDIVLEMRRIYDYFALGRINRAVIIIINTLIAFLGNEIGVFIGKAVRRKADRDNAITEEIYDSK